MPRFGRKRAWKSYPILVTHCVRNRVIWRTELFSQPLSCYPKRIILVHWIRIKLRNGKSISTIGCYIKRRHRWRRLHNGWSMVVQRQYVVFLNAIIIAGLVGIVCRRIGNKMVGCVKYKHHDGQGCTDLLHEDDKG